MEGEQQVLEEGFLTDQEIVAKSRRKLLELTDLRMEHMGLAEKAKAAKKRVAGAESELEQIIKGKRDPQIAMPNGTGPELVKSAEDVLANMRGDDDGMANGGDGEEEGEEEEEQEEEPANA